MKHKSLKKWDVPGLGEENYEIYLVHLDVSESKEVFEEWGHVKIIENTPKHIWSIDL